MPVEVKIPNIGESVSEVEITEWLKEEGEQVDQDEIIALIESEKATVELPAPAKGTLVEVLKKAGEPAQVGEIIARIAGEEGKAQRRETAGREGPERADGEGKSEAGDIEGAEAGAEPGGGKENAAARTKEKGDEGLITYIEPVIEPARETEGDSKKATQKPAESDTTEDVEETEQEDVLPETDTASDARALPRELHGGMEEELEEHGRTEGQRKEELTPMSPIRKRIARRLLQAQHEAALLTTFNEIDMSAVIALRKDQGDSFRESHGVKLGFVSFFVKAATDALKRVREVNAKIRDNHIVYHTYYDIGVAIGSERGLFVPVLRNTDRMSFAEIEKTVDDLSKRAAANQLEPGELLGGTFTVSNGGIYGSLLSTPIVNPPQSGVLGLHAIQDRPVVRKNEVVIRPMMYVALTYDHRIIDGREAVTFLKRIKETIENPVRMLLGT